jgi:low temperature requirement protein LtrA
MTLFIRRFRDWWQVPRKAGEGLEHRQVTFLELFYDLVYVVLIAQLSHALAAHINWEGLGNYAFLFIIVWWPGSMAPATTICTATMTFVHGYSPLCKCSAW